MKSESSGWTPPPPCLTPPHVFSSPSLSSFTAMNVSVRHDRLPPIMPSFRQLYVRLQDSKHKGYTLYPVPDFLQARQLVLGYITSKKIPASDWKSGQVFTEKSEYIARISYNGRIWQPEARNVPQALSTRTPFGPIIMHSPQTQQLTIWYSYLFKVIQLEQIPRKSWNFIQNDPFDYSEALQITIDIRGISIQQIQYEATGWILKPNGVSFHLTLPDTFQSIIDQAMNYSMTAG